jgi:hypothetical protein
VLQCFRHRSASTWASSSVSTTSPFSSSSLSFPLVDHVVRHHLLQPGVLSLKILQALHLLHLQAPVLLAPPAVRLLRDPSFRITSGVLWPFARSTSASRSLRMVCSGAHRFLGIACSFPGPPRAYRLNLNLERFLWQVIACNFAFKLQYCMKEAPR